MAKRRRIKNGVGASATASPPSKGRHANSVADNVGNREGDPVAAGHVDPMSIALGLLAGAVVYVAYFPSDSVAVEKGDALWLAMLALVLALVTWVFAPMHGVLVAADANERMSRWRRISDGVLGMVPWLLAAWMMIAAFGSSPPGNLRMSTNEGWWWVTAAALFTASRRLVDRVSARRAILMLMVTCSIGLAIHGLHQYFVSLPANRMEYQQNPERILELAGVEAPPGSAERMVFENRLFDGGPTGTFALANSLAAVLLLGVIAAVGVLRFSWSKLTTMHRIGWAVALLLCVGCLMAARSRSATLAMLLGITLVWIAASLRGRNTRVLWIGLVSVAALAAGGIVFLATMGNREWFEEAPASLAFRFQYWRSSWQMALDHPWFGAGPGNFQSLYERYREASATEQIAEPHNWLVETLTSGGFIGLALLLVLLAAGIAWVKTKTSRRGRDDDSVTMETAPLESATSQTDRDRWVWLGAVLSLAMVWGIGLASRQPPDLGASLWVLPISFIAAMLLWPSVAQLRSAELDFILLIVLIALGTHLMAAGGWTVPGVAIPIWLCAALLTRIDQTNDPARLPWKSSVGTRSALAAVGLSLLGLLYFGSLRPVEEQRRLMMAAASAQSRGQVAKTRNVLQQAMELDRWSPDAALWLADTYRWNLVLGESDDANRRTWAELLESVKQRAGDDPAIYRMVGTQQLHVFQRHGDPVDLEAAAKTFEKAVDWSPSNQWMMAQMSEIARARGNTEISRQLAARATELSQLGGNIERSLQRQQIYPARHVGAVAQRGPLRLSAEEILYATSPPKG